MPGKVMLISWVGDYWSLIAVEEAEQKEMDNTTIRNISLWSWVVNSQVFVDFNGNEMWNLLSSFVCKLHHSFSVQDDWVLWEVGSYIGFPSLLDPNFKSKHFDHFWIQGLVEFWHFLKMWMVCFWLLRGWVSRRPPLCSLFSIIWVFKVLVGLVSWRLPPSSPLFPSLHSPWLLASVSPQESSLVFHMDVFPDNTKQCLSQECLWCLLGSKRLCQLDGSAKMSASSWSVKEGGGLPAGRG